MDSITEHETHASNDTTETDALIEQHYAAGFSNSERNFLHEVIAGKTDFLHRDHLYLAWLLIKSLPFGMAVKLLDSILKQLATQHGSAEKFNKTITHAFAFAIKDRLLVSGSSTSWPEFMFEHDDLIDGIALIKRHYRWETAVSSEAREYYLEPDLDYPQSWKEFVKQLH